MSSVCSCDVVLGNTGLSKCPSVPQIARKLILVPYYDVDGNINEIDMSNPLAPSFGGVTGTGLNKAFFDLILNNTDKYGRMYPLPVMKNAENVRETPVFESFNDGTQEKIRDGVATFTASLTNMSPTYLAKIEQAACTPIGAFIVDSQNNLIGYSVEANKLQPIKIDEKTWAPQFMYATDSTVAKIMLSFQWDLNVMDSKISMIAGSLFAYSPYNLVGLLDVLASSLVVGSATELTVSIVTCYGSVGSLDKVEGLTVAELSLYNETTNLAIVPVSVTETSAGVYVVTFAAQTALDVLHARVALNGYDDAELRKTKGIAL